MFPMHVINQHANIVAWMRAREAYLVNLQERVQGTSALVPGTVQWHTTHVSIANELHALSLDIQADMLWVDQQIRAEQVERQYQYRQRLDSLNARLAQAAAEREQNVAAEAARAEEENETAGNERAEGSGSGSGRHHRGGDGDGKRRGHGKHRKPKGH